MKQNLYRRFINEKIKILVNTIAKVNSFNRDLLPFDSDIDLVQGRYTVDGKSIMGIFSLNLLEPITAIIHEENGELDALLEKLQPYIVESDDTEA